MHPFSMPEYTREDILALLEYYGNTRKVAEDTLRQYESDRGPIDYWSIADFYCAARPLCLSTETA
jgi:hypothetical protein